MRLGDVVIHEGKGLLTPFTRYRSRYLLVPNSASPGSSISAVS